jgi:predicted MPP superfamily phosphohydrolase
MSSLSRRRFLKLGAATLGTALAGDLYTTRIELHWLEIVRRPLPVAGLPDGLVGKTLLQLSDLHIGRRVSDGYLARVFRRAAALAPDLVVHTGDFVSWYPPTFGKMRRLFERAPRGTLATLGILGNHDYGRDWSHPEIADEVVATASAFGVRVLRNEACEIGGLQIAGLDDLWAGRFAPEGVMPRLDPARAAIALSHNPDTADLPGWGAFRGWILSGHTHGGQVRLPFLPPPFLPVRNKRYASGVCDAPGGRRLYVSRGVGHLTPVRFNVRPEITLFTLTPEA